MRDQIVTAMDWYPTLLDLCGIDAPDVALDGHSIVPLLESDDAPSPHRVLHFQWQNNWCVREGNWKLIRRRGGRESATESITLRNLDDDEPEVRDHAADQPRIVARLRSLHEAWSDEVFGGR